MESTANINEDNTTGIFDLKNIKLKFNYLGVSKTENIQIYNNANLDNIFKDYIKIRNLTEIQNSVNKYNFYLIRENQKIKLDKVKSIQQHGIKDGDLIEVSFPEIINQNENRNELSHTYQNSSENLINPSASSNKKYFIIIGSIGVILLGLIIFFTCWFVFKKPKIPIETPTDNTDEISEEEENEEEEEKKEIEKIYELEELMIEKRPYYPINELFLYKSDKEMNIELDPKTGDYEEGKNLTKITEHLDFCFIIEEKHVELYDDTLTKKNWFTGYISLLNLTINNGTDNITLSYNDELQKYINNNKLRILDEKEEEEELESEEFENQEEMEKENDNLEDEDNTNYVIDHQNDTLFVKINFYENGEIKNMQTPTNFDPNNMIYIDEIIKFIIPKLSNQIALSENITENIKQIDESFKEINETENEEENDYSENENEDPDNELLVDNDVDNDIENNNIQNNFRRNSINDTNNNMNYSNDFILDNLYNDYNKSEADIDYSTTSDEDSNSLTGLYENKTFINITNFESGKLDGVKAKLEGSQIRKLKNYFFSISNQQAILNNILEIENAYITQPDHENIKDLNEEEEKLKTEIYGENNNISRDDNEDFIGKNTPFNITGMKLNNFNNISLVKTLKNDKLVKNIIKFYSEFIYTTYDNETYFRILKAKDGIKEDNINNNNDNELEVEYSKLSKKKERKLQYINTYYGLKNFEKEKVIFKYNLIGLILEGLVVSKIDVSTGVTDSYFKLILGFVNLKKQFSSVQSNLHIIIKNSHEMTYKFMSLQYQSNEDLKERNQLYSNIILNLEKNMSKTLEDYYDYSGLFRESLEDLYDQVKNFSSQIFEDLIEVIYQAYDNYTIILNRTENNEEEIIQNISSVTKLIYINFINEMFENIISFKNQTLIFLDKVKIEVDQIQVFQLDILYDIVDSIYDGCLLFKDFIKKLFKAVERGITTFKYDLRDFMENAIGDLLYLTDFLSVNLNKNEILKNALKENLRKEATEKLKNFRNIILRILEILETTIFEEYKKEISGDNENNIKKEKELIIQNCIQEINNKSDNVIDYIKSKIAYMELYEKYANNIEIINGINNKSYIEFNNDMYYNILKDINKISPEYLNKNSNLIKNKDYLFNLSNEMISIINSEINEINQNIISYSEKYINENHYFLDSNLYNFRKYFSNDFLDSLYKNFTSILEETLKTYYTGLINKNYELAFEYMNEVESIIKKAPHYRLLGDVFINRYSKYKSYFQTFAYLPSSDEFIDFVQKNFFNVTNYVLNYIKENIESIKKNYFHETQKDTFYKLDIITQEIYRLSDNINNYFNELNFDKNIQTLILKIALNDIPNLNKEQNKKFDDLYKGIYKRAEDSKVHGSSCDVVRLDIVVKRTWKRFWRKKVYYNYYCHKKAKSQNNINKITRNLTITKDYFNNKIDKLTTDFINKFDNYFRNIIKYSQNLYDNLYKYTTNKINNKTNIQTILNNYRKIFNITLTNVTYEKIFEQINSSYLFNGSKLFNIFNKLDNDLFKIENNYYENYYLADKSDFLEYPDEIILKLNQSSYNLKLNVEIIKNKINYSLNKKLKTIIESTKMFLKDINIFNFEYIIQKVNKEDIFQEYSNNRFNFLHQFLNSILSEINSETGDSKQKILHENNYDNLYYNFSNNYYSFLSNLTYEIDDNFTYYIPHYLISSDSSQISDNRPESDIVTYTKERYSSDKNYSKYNFNIVKFRTGISNSRKYPELFNSLFDDINFDNIIDNQTIIDIDEVINYKNFLNIYNVTKVKQKEIKKEFLYFIAETLEEFDDEFINKTSELTSNYWEFMNLYKKNILNFEDIFYDDNISKTINNTLININDYFDNFNITLYNSINISGYDYFSLNLMSIFDNYFSFIENIFNKNKLRINNLLSNNYFYSIPRYYLNEIYLERRKKIVDLIDNYTKEYDYDSLGFTYDFSKDLDLVLKKYFLSYELNNSYNYFETIQNHKDFYVKIISQKFDDIRKYTENKYDLIVKQFINYMKSAPNYVEIEYIEEIKTNHSKCLKVLSNIKNKISKYLDDYKTNLNISNLTNITQTEEFIIYNCSEEIIFDSFLNKTENDTCLNLTEIDISYFLEDINFIINCENNNYYNYSYIIIDNFTEEDKLYLNECIINITNEVNSSIIDEYYLYNYIQNYYDKNTSVDINLNDYKFTFEDIQDYIFYINNLREPDYKNLMNDILIESFNKSYNSNINFYITSEIANKISILISDKFDIFIDYYNNTVKNEYDYYSFLLSTITQLGNSSKTSIINLFTKIPKKINETIYYLIEDEIFFYIDIFFRENKNIYINSFLKFYLNDISDYNMNYYKIKEYVEEMIANKEFNRSLNDISLNIIGTTKNKIKKNIINSISTKITSFIDINKKINDNITVQLNAIQTYDTPDDMKNLVALINNYTDLTTNQNNRFNFIIGDEPFNFLNIYINQTLSPPILLIKEKYDLIQEDLLSQIIAIANNFPNVSGEVKENYPGNKIDIIEENRNEINSTLINYQNDLDEDIDSYINKSIHYIYIDGLNTMSEDKCKNADCGIQKKSLRRLKEKSILNMRILNSDELYTINKTKIENYINKNINLNIKRKTSVLPDYSPDMGALSEKDILYYLSDLQNTIYKLNKSYLGKEYRNINISAMKYFSKMNYTYLQKLKLTFDIKLVKFSTIFTKDNLENLKKIILKQYYEIEDHVNFISNLMQNKINYFINEINDTSIFIENLGAYIYTKVVGYYKILHSSIQNRYKVIDNNRRLEKNSIIPRRIDSQELEYMKKNFIDLLDILDDTIKNEMKKFVVSEVSKKFFDKMNKHLSKISKELSQRFSFEKQISFPFPAMPFFEIVLRLRAYAGYGVNIAFRTQLRETFEPILTFDVYAEAGVGLDIEGGFYLPSSSSPIQINFVVGLGGTIGEGKAGIKLEFSLITNEVAADVYFELYAFKFDFYFRIAIKIDISFFKYHDEFYIVRLPIKGIEIVLHSNPKLLNK